MSDASIDSKSRELQTIVETDKFQLLVKTRNKTRFILSVLTLLSHAFFVGGIAFYSHWFAQPISNGSSIPKGILYTIVVIASLVFLEFVYLYLNKKNIEPLLKEINAKVSKNV
ncbi:MAG: DUF485 domain-containing protein [Kangiellaceae bacterium]|nr:DUF485 domain-containing protein [Kangiellaceae bacterium]